MWDGDKKDIRPGLIVLAGLFFVAVKLLLASAQNVYLQPGAAPIDDDLAFAQAVSITEGNWLGEYGYLTLSKHSFFSLWLAVLHWLHIPYLLGGQLLWVLAALAAAVAFLPLLHKRWLGFCLFLVLLFSPSSTANALTPPSGTGEALGYITRVYRDNIFPALCLLCIAGMVGFALRRNKGLKKTFGWPVLAGVAGAACYLTREDGWWLLPFMVAAALVTAVFLFRRRKKGWALRGACLLAPFLLLAGGVLSWSGVNYSHYGVFTVSDFTSGAFADAYGAMTRVEGESFQPLHDVPEDVRFTLYEYVPSFALLQPVLEDKEFKQRFGDYNSGAFYWALREAAAHLGIYETPQTAEKYWGEVASEINTLCDMGTLPSRGGRRSSVSPPIRMEYVGPVLAETAHGLWFCATFQQCEPGSLFSPHSNDAAFYEEKIQPMEAFLGESALTVSQENSTLPYYSPRQRVSFGVLNGIRWLYAALLPAALLVAFAWQCMGLAGLVGRLKRREKNEAEAFGWWIGLGLLGCILLRLAMIGFVTVSSFTIGTYVMYLASVHPLLLAYAFVGTAGFVRLVAARRPARGKEKG